MHDSPCPHAGSLNFTEGSYATYTLEELNLWLKDFSDSKWENEVRSFILSLPPGKTLTGVLNCKCLFNYNIFEYLKHTSFDAVLLDPYNIYDFIVAKYFSLLSVAFSRTLICLCLKECGQCPSLHVHSHYLELLDTFTFKESAESHFLIDTPFTLTLFWISLWNSPNTWHNIWFQSHINGLRLRLSQTMMPNLVFYWWKQLSSGKALVWGLFSLFWHSYMCVCIIDTTLYVVPSCIL